MIHKLKREVETILFQNPVTRNSDIVLWVEIVKTYYHGQFKELCLSIRGATGIDQTWPRLLAFMHDAPNQDNVKRIRADFNAKGKYLPTDWRVAKKRGMNEIEWKQALGYSTLTPADHVEMADQQRHLKML